MTDRDLIARFESLVTAWNDRDVDRIVAAFSPEARFRHAATRRVGVGREAVRADAEALLRAIPDLHLEVRRTLTARSVVTCEWTVSGTSPDALAATARPVERDGVLIADYDAAGQVLGFVRYETPTFSVRPCPAAGADTPMKRATRKLIA
jgi:hypothetical protein